MVILYNNLVINNNILVVFHYFLDIYITLLHKEQESP
jgi:hypothetical protein